jgi:hypothetical protein
MAERAGRVAGFRLLNTRRSVAEKHVEAAVVAEHRDTFGASVRVVIRVHRARLVGVLPHEVVDPLVVQHKCVPPEQRLAAVLEEVVEAP